MSLTGRLMSEPLEGIPRLDHAVTATLLLAYCGLRTGDRVGMFAFDSQARRFVPPTGGIAAFARMQDASAELRYSTEETNFTVAFADLVSRLQRRSLVVVFTDFTDSVQAELLAENLGRAARRHLLLFVALKDAVVERIADGKVEKFYQETVLTEQAFVKEPEKTVGQILVERGGKGALDLRFARFKLGESVSRSAQGETATVASA